MDGEHRHQGRVEHTRPLVQHEETFQVGGDQFASRTQLGVDVPQPPVRQRGVLGGRATLDVVERLGGEELGEPVVLLLRAIPQQAAQLGRPVGGKPCGCPGSGLVLDHFVYSLVSRG